MEYLHTRGGGVLDGKKSEGTNLQQWWWTEVNAEDTVSHSEEYWSAVWEIVTSVGKCRWLWRSGRRQEPMLRTESVRDLLQSPSVALRADSSSFSSGRSCQLRRHLPLTADNRLP